MALITCKNCGKNISDKTEKCIHCGHPVNEDVEVAEESVTSTHIESPEDDKRPIFHQLPASEQRMLEETFVNTDPWALSYRRKKGELKKFYNMHYTAWLCAAVSALCGQRVDNYASGTFWAILAQIAMVVVALVWVGTIVMVIYTRISNDNKLNIVRYNKKFEKWLLEEKGIKYIPNLPSEKAKRLYSQIDIDDI